MSNANEEIPADDAAYSTFEIGYESADDADEGCRRLTRSGFSVEDVARHGPICIVRAGSVDREGDADTRLDDALTGLRFDPVVYWQTARLTYFTESPS